MSEINKRETSTAFTVDDMERFGCFIGAMDQANHFKFTVIAWNDKPFVSAKKKDVVAFAEWLLDRASLMEGE
jgi:hypothetical protein